MSKIIISYPINFFFLTCFFISLAKATPDNLATERGIFIRAEHALKQGDRATYQRLAPQISHYPLYPYLIYEALKQQIATTPPALSQLKAFEKQFPDFPFNNALKTRWLHQMAKNKNWPAYLAGYQPSSDAALQCYYYYGQYQVTHDPLHLKQAKSLWLVGHSQPPACDLLFRAWYQTPGFSNALLWKRLALAIKYKNNTLAHYLIKQLPSEERAYAKKWQQVIHNPYLVLKKNIRPATIPLSVQTQLLFQGLYLLAKKDPEAVCRWWQDQSDFPFSKSQTAHLRRMLGIALSHQKSPLASPWLATLKEHADSVTQEWQIRLALADTQWHQVITLIQQLPLALKEQRKWRYWEARALEATGKKEQARPLYQALAKSRDYYGFLSSTRVRQAISLQHQSLAPPSSARMSLFALPAFQRFKELLALNRIATARVEWFRAIEKCDPLIQQAAAKFAHEKGLHDIAILTLSKNSHKNDILLRFPLAHRDTVLLHSYQHNIDPAWVFAIARQESAFFSDALSAAGARGIMQLLPSTAESVAKQHRLAYDTHASLHHPHMNIQLGTAYLQKLKQQMQNHFVLATAAYNAGPTRIQRWLPKKNFDSDIWIETIPYQETREYVKNVLTFTSIYRYHLGSPSTFSLMMRPIPSQL